MVRVIWDHSFGVWRTDAAFWEEIWPAEKASFLEEVFARLQKSEPLAYVLGKAPFMNLVLDVNPSVLIPRPETEELVDWILQSGSMTEKNVLDLCTGSGCIALALRKYGDWQTVSGLDVSKEALETAQRNGSQLGLAVRWLEVDLLRTDVQFDEKWEVWVSNPPYVLKSESGSILTSVLDFEPSLALFVPDLDPIVFYRIILELGQKYLKPGGALYFELNPMTAGEVVALFAFYGYEKVELKKDMSGKNRMVRGFRPLD